MAIAPNVDGLVRTAASFARTALEAHHAEDHQRVAVDAGTALEHLTKACLARRSPALLTDLRPGNWLSLALLAGVTEAQPKHLRTVGLREALDRVRILFTGPAVQADLQLLVDLRDGVVHTALDNAVEEQLLLAFVQQADATLEEMDRPRTSFWFDQLDVVDALLADASDKVAHRVAVRMAAAKAEFAKKYDDMPDELTELIRRLQPGFEETEEALTTCPACESQGAAGGDFSVDVDGEMDRDGTVATWSWVVFTATSFACTSCGLRLDSPAEMAMANMDLTWDMPDLDPSRFRERDDWDY